MANDHLLKLSFIKIVSFWKSTEAENNSLLKKKNKYANKIQFKAPWVLLLGLTSDCDDEDSPEEF